MMPLFDALVACALPVLAWRALATQDATKSVVLFMAFGFLSAIAWARLAAPDIALVEAAVGTGVTGALLVTTLRALGPATAHAPKGDDGGRVANVPSLAVAGLALLAALGIAAAIAGVPDDAGLVAEVRAALPHAGAQHPVTAVLLDFRAYDTLLEVVVLVVAVLAAREGARVSQVVEREHDSIQPLLAALVRLLVPGIVLVAGYLLWRGAKAPGGAFQAAAVLAGGGILAQVAGMLRVPQLESRWVRALFVIGPAVFLIIAAVPLFTGARLLEYPDGSAGPLIFAIELVLMISIALFLVLFFPGEHQRAREEDAP